MIQITYYLEGTLIFVDSFNIRYKNLCVEQFEKGIRKNVAKLCCEWKLCMFFLYNSEVIYVENFIKEHWYYKNYIKKFGRMELYYLSKENICRIAQYKIE